MSAYRFILQPYNGMKTRYQCPNCERKTFTRYIDVENQEHINNTVGKCSRLIKCAYHYSPRDYFNDNNFTPTTSKIKLSNNIQTKIKPTYIKKNILDNSLKHTNNFIHFLEEKLFGEEETNRLVDLYNIGTSNHWEGSTVFWQVDEHENIRSGKIMLYNRSNGKRVKEPFNHINWIHKTLKIEDFNLEQCFFGQHLLKDNSNDTVAIVESEKTAVIASVFIPEFIWIACGSLNNLSEQRTAALKGRNVVLFPDLKCYDLWLKKVPKLSKYATYHVSDLLEKKSSGEEKEKGYDLADYLINLNINYYNNDE